MRSFLVVVVVVLLSHYVAASTTLENKLMTSRPPAPNCPDAPATFNRYSREWVCPSTCSDGSQPECLVQPCAATSCLAGQVCVDNYCPNFPVAENGRCTAKCVTPVNCLKDPCQVAQGQPPRCGAGQVCQADYRFGCGFTCQPAPTCPQVCTRACAVGFSCQTDANGCKACLPTPTASPHCTSNEGNPVAPGTGFRVRCNACGCQENGTVGICTQIACDSSKCWDDQGNSYIQGATITRGCKTGTCTHDANGLGVWAWQGC